MEGYVDYHRSPNATYCTIQQYNDRFGTSIPENEKYDIYFKETYDKAREETPEGEPITTEIYTIDQSEWLAFVEEDDEEEEKQQQEGEEEEKQEQDEETEDGEENINNTDNNIDMIDKTEDGGGEEEEEETAIEGGEEVSKDEQSLEGETEMLNNESNLQDEIQTRENMLKLREALTTELAEEYNDNGSIADTQSLQNSLSTMIEHAEKTDEMVDNASYTFQDHEDNQSITSIPNSLKTISTDAANRIEAHIKDNQSKRGARNTSSFANSGRHPGIGGGANRDNGANYINNVKFQMRLEKANTEIEELSKLLQHRDREIRRLKETIYAKESTINGLRSETDAMRQECALLEDSARRAERNNKRKTRQLKNIKDQLNKTEEINRDLQRRVNAQRTELKTYSETIKLMEQSRQEAEDAADSAQRQLRQAQKQLQMSPSIRGSRTFKSDRNTYRSPRQTRVNNTRRSAGSTGRRRGKIVDGDILPRIESQSTKTSPNFSFDEYDANLGGWSSRGNMTPPSVRNSKVGRKPDSNRRIVDRYAQRDERGVAIDPTGTYEYKNPDERVLNTEAARLAAIKVETQVKEDDETKDEAEPTVTNGNSTVNEAKDPIKIATELNEAAVKVQARARGFLQRNSPPKKGEEDNTDVNEGDDGEANEEDIKENDDEEIDVEEEEEEEDAEEDAEEEEEEAEEEEVEGEELSEDED